MVEVHILDLRNSVKLDEETEHRAMHLVLEAILTQGGDKSFHDDASGMCD